MTNNKQMTSSKQDRGQGDDGERTYDLEERTCKYAVRVRAFVKRLPPTLGNREDGRQLVRSSGSAGANYIEANESLSKKDFCLRIKIARKEAKESRYWLRLLDTCDDLELDQELAGLIQESTELLKILSSILQKSQ